MNNNIHSNTENDFNNGFIKHNNNNVENVKLSKIIENIKLKTNIEFIDTNTSIYTGTTLLVAGGFEQYLQSQ